ncbi:MAG TPA: glycosyltransferase [Acidimicrobiales bacterium]|nr:glycosyltransferase [Acidimicrobiales bacterium]
MATALSRWVSYLPLGFIALVSWGTWLVRTVMAHRARPVQNDFRTTTSVVVPVYREDPEILSLCLDTWVASGPDELILVVDTADTACLDMLGHRVDPDFVDVHPFPHRGKRSALAEGIRRATAEVVVLVDSDTAWTPGLLDAVQMPFVDRWVGGVGTRQVVAARQSSLWRRIASWLLDVRYADYTPAMGAHGSVPCLSGRTAAYRRALLTPMLPQLEHEVFLGRECVAGDDGRLTWLVLSTGHTTVQQSQAVAISMFPANLRGFVHQRTRWSRNSYRCYLTAIRHGWLWQQALITQITVLQILLTPVTMGVAVFCLGRAVWIHTPAVAALFVAWALVGRGIRGLSHLRQHPQDLPLLPVVMLTIVFISLPLKLYAMVTMNRQGWLTRQDNRLGGEAQTRATLGTDGFAA